MHCIKKVVSMSTIFRCLSFRTLSVLCALLFSLGFSVANDGGIAPEKTHAERFAPREEKLQLALNGAESRVKSNPNDADAWLDLGLVHLRLNQIDAGCTDFRRAATLAPMRAQPKADLAYALWMQGHTDEALAAARAALVLNPNNAYAQRYFGRLMLLRGGNLTEGIEYLEKAVQQDPEMTDVHFDLLMAYRAAGNKPNAWAELRILETEFAADYPRLLYVQGLLASDQGRSALSKRAASLNAASGQARAESGRKEAVDLRLGTLTLRWRIGVVCLAMIFQPGLPVALTNFHPGPASRNKQLSFINECFIENQVAVALKAADDFEHANADNPEALYHLAIIFAAHAQHPRAAQLFTRVNELRPHSPGVLYNLGIASYRCHHGDKASAALAESADLDGKPADTHFVLALIAAEQGDDQNAILEARHAIARVPNRADYYALLGQEYSKVGYWQGSAAAYRRATAIDPSRSTYFLELGKDLLFSLNLEDAIKAFQQAGRLDRRLAEINYLIGFAYQQSGQFEKAGEFYRRQLAIDPNDIKSLVGSGVVAVEDGHFADAEKFIKASLAHDPNNVEANYESGLMCFNQHQYDQAILTFKHVLWLRPDHTQAEYYLYLALARSHQNAAAAEALAEWKKLQKLDRKVRAEEMAYDMERAGQWQNGQSASPR